MKYTFVDKQDREKLSEGRNFGFGGGFCKREGNTFTTIMPISACGDYFAEIVHSEATSKKWSVYGLSTYKQDIFDHKLGVAYMVCAILETNHGGKYSNYDRDYTALHKNYKQLEKFLNWFETKFKSKKKTKITKLEDNRFLFTIPLFWCDGTYKISLYKLLSRMAIFYEGGNPIKYLENFNQCSSDKMYLNTIKDKLNFMLNGNIPVQTMTASDSCPHNMGIVSYNKFGKMDNIKKDYFKSIKSTSKLPVPAAKPTDKLKPMNFV